MDSLAWQEEKLWHDRKTNIVPKPSSSSPSVVCASLVKYMAILTCCFVSTQPNLLNNERRTSNYIWYLPFPLLPICVSTITDSYFTLTTCYLHKLGRYIILVHSCLKDSIVESALVSVKQQEKQLIAQGALIFSTRSLAVNKKGRNWEKNVPAMMFSRIMWTWLSRSGRVCSC